MSDVISGLSGGLGLANGASGFAPPVQSAVSRLFNSLSPQSLPPPVTLIELRHKGKISPEMYVKGMR